MVKKIMEIRLMSKKMVRYPATMVILTFALADLLGALLLYAPWMHHDKLSFLDALFTSTSAICVTGLTVVDTAHTFTRSGHWIIMLLMELGGLGVMTFSILFALTLKKQIGISSRFLLQENFLHIRTSNIKELVRSIFLFTIVIEGLAAFFMTIGFWHRLPFDQALFQGIFHAISAFCNAGFSTLPNGLLPYKNNWLISLSIIFTILLGNTGFSVFYELKERLINRKNNRFSLHFRLTVWTHLFLIVIGTVGILFFERHGLLAGETGPHKLLVALFHSVSARTAGFNTIPITRLTEDSLYLILLLMFIGACPGSTGGGIKTTTVAVLWFTAVSRLKGFSKTVICHRSIPEGSVHKALTLFVLAVMTTLGAHILLMFAGPNLPFSQSRSQFLAYLFETISGLGTVGLSVGLTPQLGITGKIVMILIMFAGRVGLLSILSVLTSAGGKPKPYNYVEENIMVG